MEFSVFSIAAMLLTAGIGIVATLFGDKYAKIKAIIIEIGDAIEDDTITMEEVQKIWKKVKKLL